MPNTKSVASPDKILKTSETTSKELAHREAEDFSEERLEQEAKKTEHSRREFSKALVHVGQIFLIVVLYSVMVMGIVSLGWHWVVSENYHYLNYEQINTLKNIIFSAMATNISKEFLKTASH